MFSKLEEKVMGYNSINYKVIIIIIIINVSECNI